MVCVLIPAWVDADSRAPSDPGAPLVATHHRGRVDSRVAMPELPEVETVARLIRPRLVGRRIVGCEVRWVRTLGGLAPERFERAVVGARVTRVWRRAKFVVVDLERDGRSAGALVGHLRMTGRMQVDERGVDPGKF